MTIRKDLPSDRKQMPICAASAFITSPHSDKRLRRGRFVTSSMLPRLLPFLVSLVFWRKKPRQNAPDEAVVPNVEIENSVTESDASHSREILKVLKLERDIIGTALTTIYESEIQRIITRDERDRLLDKYSSDLKALESRISEHQRIVDTFDLESAKKELLLSYRTKISEIEKKLADLRSGATFAPSIATQSKSDQVPTPDGKAEIVPQSGLKVSGAGLQEAKARTEKKIEAIKEEVLKAMERLEQIESEG